MWDSQPRPVIIGSLRTFVLSGSMDRCASGSASLRRGCRVRKVVKAAVPGNLRGPDKVAHRRRLARGLAPLSAPFQLTVVTVECHCWSWHAARAGLPPRAPASSAATSPPQKRTLWHRVMGRKLKNSVSPLYYFPAAPLLHRNTSQR